jgi:hypothetical protein
VNDTGVMQKESDALAASLFKVGNFPDPFD